MGITIHYQGKIAKPENIPQLCSELNDIAASMGWNIVTVPAENDIETKLNGVVLNCENGLEPLPFLFDENGILRSISRLLDPSDDRDYTFIISCKTQFASPKDHAWICGLLRYLQRQYMPDLIVNDEGEFWDTGDMELLTKHMDFLDKQINQMTDKFSNLPTQKDASPDDIANLICEQLQTPPKPSTSNDASPQLKQQLNELYDGNITFGPITELDDIAGYEDSFLKYVEEYETAPMTSYAKELIKNKILLPSPDQLTASQLHEKLWEIIRYLAKMRVFLYSTNHLSDRELYNDLWNDLLNHEIPCLFYNPDSAWHLDILGSGSEDDTRLWLRYYATEEERANWANEFPEDSMPPCEEPPYNRDHLLPKCDH